MPLFKCTVCGSTTDKPRLDGSYAYPRRCVDACCDGPAMLAKDAADHLSTTDLDRLNHKTMKPTPTITIDEATTSRLEEGAAVFFQDETSTLFFLTRITQCGDRPWRWAYVALTKQAEPRCIAKSVRSAIKYALDDGFALFVADSLEGVLAAIKPNAPAVDITPPEPDHWIENSTPRETLEALRRDVEAREEGGWSEAIQPVYPGKALFGPFTAVRFTGPKDSWTIRGPDGPVCGGSNKLSGANASIILQALNIHAKTGKTPHDLSNERSQEKLAAVSLAKRILGLPACENASRQVHPLELVEEAFRTLQAERDELAQWKESALAVERGWDLQAIGNLCGLTIGDDIRPAIQPTLENLIALLRSLLNSGRFGGDSDPLARRIHLTLRNLNQI